jgi:uncharacterized protein YxeA
MIDVKICCTVGKNAFFQQKNNFKIKVFQLSGQNLHFSFVFNDLFKPDIFLELQVNKQAKQIHVRMIKSKKKCT